MAAGLLAQQLHALVMVVEVGGAPARRQVGHDPIVNFRRRSPLADQADAPQHPQMMGVDHQGFHSEGAEIQGRRCGLAADPGQPFQPGESVANRPAPKKVEGEAAARRCDLLQSRFQTPCLHVSESYRMDHPMDLRCGRVAQPLPASVTLPQRNHSTPRNCALRSAADQAQDQLADGIGKMPGTGGSKLSAQPFVDVFESLFSVVEIKRKLHRAINIAPF